MIELRPYQDDMLTRARDALRRKVKNVFLQLPTGGGKTALTATMFGNASARHLRCAFAVHRDELVRQSMQTFDAVGIKYGVVSPSHPGNIRQPVQIVSIPTWMRRMDRLGKFDLIAWDEAHHVAARTWAKLHENQQGAIHIGLSATPQRLDGTGLRGWFSELICGPNTRWLIEQGFLSPYRYFEPTVAAIDEDGKSAIVGDAVTQYQRIAAGRRALYFCKSVEHSKNVADAFRAVGISSAHMDGDTHMDDRVLTMRRFRAGEIQVLCNRDLFGEGVDVPGIECIGLLRKTESLSLFLQWIGRGLRASPGKTDCVVLDHCGNRQLHGMPDEERVWTLDGCMAKIGDKEAAGKRCPICFAMTYSGAKRCSECGHKFVSAEGGQVRTVDGELEEVDPNAYVAVAKAQAADERKLTYTREGLVQLAKMRGYANPEWWADKVLSGRKKRKAA